MLKTKFTTRFKKDYKRMKRAQNSAQNDKLLHQIISSIVTGKTLPSQFQDHALTGNWKDHRECHIRPDLLMIYRYLDDNVVELVRLGSHSELGL